MHLIMTIFALIDWMVYGLVSKMFSIIFLIAEVDIFKDGALDALSNRVYGVLGVIILFKIIISAIQYLINPDKMADKDKGMGGLLTRTIISIALLALVPTIFTFAKDAQVIVSKAIPAIIIGREVGADDSEDIEEAGNWMAFTTLSTFIQEKDPSKVGNDEKINDFDSFLTNITAGCGFFEPSKCKYTYQFIFSIPVGIFMLYVMLSMGIDIAIRSIKLGILQLLAPIPIASYINNQENFKSWYTTCFKVYADLFIRLILIYFIVFVMGIIASGQVSLGDNMLVQIYMIIAILLFAKSAPKFISDALGLKGDGMGGIADMFKPAWSRAHAPVLQAINPLRSGISHMRNSWTNSRDIKDSTGNRLKAFFKGAQRVGMAASSFGRGALTGALDSAISAGAGEDAAKMRQRMLGSDAASMRRGIKGARYRANPYARVQNAYEAVDRFFGGNPINGDSYIKASGDLKNLRATVLTGRAKSEMDKDSNFLDTVSTRLGALNLPNSFVLATDNNGIARRDVQTTFDYDSASGATLNFGFAEISALYNNKKLGKISDGEAQRMGFTNAEEIENAFEKIGKKAYAEKCRISWAAKNALESNEVSQLADTDPIKVALKSLIDNTINGDLERFRQNNLGVLGVDKATEDKLVKEFNMDIGKFLIDADAVQQAFNTKGTALKATEVPKDGK